MDLFRKLDEQEEAAFRRWARENYVRLTPISGLWHPVVQDECRRMNEGMQLTMCLSCGGQCEPDRRYCELCRGFEYDRTEADTQD